MSAKIYPFVRAEHQPALNPVAIWWAWAMFWPAFFMPVKRGGKNARGVHASNG